MTVVVVVLQFAMTPANAMDDAAVAFENGLGEALQLLSSSSSSLIVQCDSSHIVVSTVMVVVVGVVVVAVRDD